MKKLTLDETWELCLKMWSWIVEQVRNDDTQSVNDLKEQWLDDNGYVGGMYPQLGCFLCAYDNQHEMYCCSCPARLVDNEFSCENTEYAYDILPMKFYTKLIELNDIRLKGKRDENY